MSAEIVPGGHISEDEVRREVLLLANLVGMRELTNLQMKAKHGEFLLWNLFFFPIVALTNRSFRHGIRREVHERELVRHSAEALGLLRQPRARAELCPLLQELEGALSKLAARTVERDAVEVAILLTRRANSPVPGDTVLLARDASARLIAVCSWMIARRGIENYCRTNS